MRAAGALGVGSALCTGLLFGAPPSLAPSRANPGIGEVAPGLSLPDLDGRIFALAAKPGHPVIVEFSATWCEPCHRAARDLAELLAPLGGKVTLVVVDVGEDPARVSQHVAATPPHPGATLLIDREGGAARAWGADRYPTTFILDGGGVIRHINRGHGPGYRARVDRWLRTMMREPQARGAPRARAQRSVGADAGAQRPDASRRPRR